MGLTSAFAGSAPQPAVEVKGPTLTELVVRRDEASGEWTCQCVVDV